MQSMAILMVTILSYVGKEILGVGLHWWGDISIVTASVAAGLGLRSGRFMFAKTIIRTSVY